MRTLELHLYTLGFALLAACGSATGERSGGPAGTGGGAATGGGAGAPAGGAAGSGATDGGIIVDDDSGPNGSCVPDHSVLTPAGPEAVLAAAYASLYTVYHLGAVPGMPPGHLGGCTIAANDPNTLLVVGDSESETAGLWAIPVARDACRHIIGWNGVAKKLADAPFMDANLPYTDQDVLLYSMWPSNKLGQLLPGATSPSLETDLSALGVTDSPGGLAFVPSYLPAAGHLRAVSWPLGRFFHLEYSVSNPPLLDITGASQAAKVVEGGGFAYVPPGSPGFDQPSLIMAEWQGRAVVTYEVDDAGDPIAGSRKPFFSSFPQPWGAYFEPETGDYLFLTWVSSPDRVYIVQGFEKPPPPPPPPK
ncbi:MAG: hypothetical protein OZ921_02080 [Sorangiineae bacterium]|nr:hypothetical protein [Polyangiaceae bacterium]MEB2321273.1 hypothetical protein [Sorangiineae bacterium]